MKPKTYSEKELANHRYFHLIIATSGLENPKKVDTINLGNACSTCKSGRILDRPINIPKNTMGKKLIDQNKRFGYLIFDNNLSSTIELNKLKGISFDKTILGRNTSDFKEGIIQNEMPKMNLSSVILKKDICPTCQKSGHYSYIDKVNEFWYDKTIIDALTEDFYLTWEHFGIWDMGQTFPSIIISQKARNILSSLKQRHLKFEPIFEK